MSNVEREQTEKWPKGKSPRDYSIGGSHYGGAAIQPIDFVLANDLNFCQANVIKYVFRYRDKNGKEDLLKARHYIDLLIEHEYPDAADDTTPSERRTPLVLGHPVVPGVHVQATRQVCSAPRKPVWGSR